MTKNLRKGLALLLILAVSFTFAGCAQPAKTPAASESPAVAENTAEPSASVELAASREPEATATAAATGTLVSKIKAAGKLVLGTSADYPPYEFHRAVNGNDTIVGFDIEIGKQIAKELGVELQIKDMKFDGLLAALGAGNIDMVIAGMTPTPERKQSVDFSNIYYKAGQGILIRTEDKSKFTTLDSLKGQRIGAQKGAVQETLAKEQIADSKVLALGKIPDLVLSLKTKKVAAIAMEVAVAKLYVQKNKDLFLMAVPLKDAEGGSAVALNKGGADLMDVINKTLDKLTADGTVEKYVIEANALNLNE